MDETPLATAVYVLLFIAGASLGSYLNVVAYRVPLGLSTLLPASRCPECQKPISIWGLIPILGYSLLKGRCENCKTQISWVYPLVEALTGLATCVVVFFHMGAVAFYSEVQSFLMGRGLTQSLLPLVISLWLLYTAIPLSIIDLRYRILPDRITLPGIITGLVLGSLNPHLGPVLSLLGAFLGSGFLFGVAKAYERLRGREGMGLGDVKYLAMLGSVVGPYGVLQVVIVSSFLGAVVGIALGIGSKAKLMSTELPFGPFLALAGLLVHLFGDQLL